MLTKPILEASGLSKSFGGFFAVQRVDFRLASGSIHAVIGPNGAGKSTLFKLLTKFLTPTSGKILYNGDDVTSLAPPAIANRGVVSSFQISAIFSSLTVLQNIEVALLKGHGLAWNMLGQSGRHPTLRKRAMEAIERFGLADVADITAGTLSYGRKRVLELATTVALEPKVMLLDEPMAGLGREDISRVTGLIREAGKGRTVLLVEHNMKVVAELADRITVMARGEVLAEGSYAEVSARSDVMAVYTGQSHG